MDIQHKVVSAKMTTFDQRLRQACADHPDIPDYGKGLQTELAKAMKVSQEAVRKWLAGETQPRQPAMIRLAKFLGVEYVWLALGTSETEFARLKQVSAKHDGAVHALIAFMILKGYNVAFPNDDVTNADIHAIGHGVQRNLSVRLPERTGDCTVRLTCPMPDDTVSLIAAIPIHQEDLRDLSPVSASLMYDFIWVTSDTIKKHGQRSGTQWELDIKYSKTNTCWKIAGKPTGTFLGNMYD